MQHGLAAIEVLDELRDAACVAELGALRLAGLGIGGALIGQRDFQSLVQEGEFAQPLRQRVVVVFGRGEDGLVRKEVNLGAALLARSRFAQFAGRQAAAEIHLPGVPVAPDLDIELLRQRIHAAHAHAVQSAGDLVVRGVELAARVKLGQHHLHCGHHLPVAHRHHVHRNAATVIDHRDRVVDVNRDVNLLRIAGQRFVDGVVYYFVNQVMQAHLAGRADVHRRTQPHGLQPFENLDVFAGVIPVVVRHRI